MTQYDMKVLEKIGLLKMDFLGLANLTMLAKALDNVKQRHGVELDLGNLPLDDPKTYAMLGRGETRTVFQLEGSGMTPQRQSSCSRRRSTTSRRWSRCIGPARWRTSPATSRDATGASRPTHPDPVARADVLEETLRHHRLPGPGAPGRAQAGRATAWARPTSCAARWARRKRRSWRARARSSSSRCIANGYPHATAERVWELLAAVRGLRLQQGARRTATRWSRIRRRI